VLSFQFLASLLSEFRLLDKVFHTNYSACTLMKLSKKQGIVVVAFLAVVACGWGIFRTYRVATRNIQGQSPLSANQSQVQQNTPQGEIDSVKDLVDGEYTFPPMDTSTWQTYRNEELGFEVKIPKSWVGVVDSDSVCLEEKGREYFVEGSVTCPVRISSSKRENLQSSEFHDLLSRRMKTSENKTWHALVDGHDAIVSFGFGNVAAFVFYEDRYYLVSSELDGAFKSGENFYQSELVTIYPTILARMVFLS